jgi:hypothetical protein
MMQVRVFNSAYPEQPGTIQNLKLIDLCMDSDDRPYAIVENPYFPGEKLRATYNGDSHSCLWGVDLD